jgi:hypothetical protein
LAFSIGANTVRRPLQRLSCQLRKGLPGSRQSFGAYFKLFWTRDRETIELARELNQCRIALFSDPIKNRQDTLMNFSIS